MERYQENCHFSLKNKQSPKKILDGFVVKSQKGLRSGVVVINLSVIMNSLSFVFIFRFSYSDNILTINFSDKSVVQIHRTCQRAQNTIGYLHKFSSNINYQS